MICMHACMHACMHDTAHDFQEDFLKEVTVLSEREKKLSLDVTGDFYTVQEMKDMNVSEILGLIGTYYTVYIYYLRSTSLKDSRNL